MLAPATLSDNGGFQFADCRGGFPCAAGASAPAAGARRRRSEARDEFPEPYMLTNIKALVVVLAIALTMFALARPFVLRYTEADDFARRRKVWLFVTAVAFLSPSIWLYALAVTPVVYWAALKDRNPLAFFVLIAFAVPDAHVQIPTIGIGQLFEFSHRRMLSMAVLTPLIFMRRSHPGMADGRRFTAADWSVAGLGLLQLALVMPYDSITNTMRRGVVFYLDTFVMFYVFARLRPTPRLIREVMASFVLMTAILSPLAVFESIRGWILYIGIGQVWGAAEGFTAYIFRGGLLRAQVSTGHSLALGYVTAMGLGMWFYFSGRERSFWAKTLTLLVLAAGVFVSGSRGAWLTAMIAFAVYVALRPDAGRYLGKVLPVLALLIVVAYNSPLKESVIDRLPIIGTAEQDTVEYRQQIAEVSWRLIKQNPFFGDPFALRNMTELKQGQGIIDIMNGYANVAVFSGGVGFAFFIATFVIVLIRCFSVKLRAGQVDPDFACLGAVLIACLLASLFFIGTAAVDSPAYWIAGLMACYSSVASARQAQTVSFRPAQRLL